MEQIVAFFTQASVPQTGLAPLIYTYDVRTGAVIDNGTAMTEMDAPGSGWYRFDFSPDKFYVGNYCYMIDGTATITSAGERYQYGIV